jgi:hypothetical protein
MKYFWIIACFCLFACEKEPGFGGLASVTGRVYAYDYTPTGVLEGEGYTGDIDVFIKVEGDTKELERVRTDLDGSFSFTELRKGTYIIWVYSFCDECTNNQEAFTQTITIEKNKDHIVLEDFKIDI